MRRPRPARLAGATLTAALAAGLLVATPAAQAADPWERKQQVEQDIEDLEHALEESSAELRAAAVALQKTEQRLPVAQAELEQAQAAAAEAKAKDVELAGRLAAATESEVKAVEAIADGEAEVAAARTALGQIAAQAYRGGTINPTLALVLDAQSPTDFADRYVLVDTALRTQNGALARLNEQQALRAHSEARLAAVQDEIERLKAEAAANLAAARQAESDAADRKAEIEALKAEQAEAVAVIEARRESEMQRLDQAEADRAALEAEIRRIEEERRRQEEERRRQEELRKQREAERRAQEAREREAAEDRAPSRGRSAERAPAPAPEPAPAADGLSWPVNARISSHYGYRIHPIYNTRRLHAGTDFAASCGTPVRAAADGTVIRAGVNGGYGNQIVVHHGTLRGQGVASSYNHLSGYAVRGGSVSRGQVIGYVGTTGTSTGCHLHFEVYVNGSTQNPMNWL
ncbi:peptidoglycan DD-metalloendopeptidase family protein [Quadrisphaera sp. GCM10027208]|uniref:peptidoglycan DD-metalloendopeptidase family protein n=1 Tax=Quadrisphaera sp. GCM10027208 TaxID=3273423 RepID=UPI0036097A4B